MRPRGWIVVGAALAAAGGLAAGAAPGAGADVMGGPGTATSYDSVDGGNCGFPGPPVDHLDVALSHVEYGTADACGGYLDVTGPDGTVRVEITNQCPECAAHHVDLSGTAFARIARPELGQVPVSYTLVRNPPLADTLAVRVKSGSSRWWLQIQAIDAGNPLRTVDLRAGAGWRALVRSDDNFWTAENPGPGDGPLTVRITDIYGQQLTVAGIALAPDRIQRTGGRLYGPGAGGTATVTGSTGSTPATAPPTTAPPATEPPATVPAPTVPSATSAPTTVPARPATRAAAASGRAHHHRGGLGAGAGLVGGLTAAALAAGVVAVRRLAGQAGGRRTVNRQPPDSLRTTMSPRWAATNPRAMASPSPAPPEAPGDRAASPR